MKNFIYNWNFVKHLIFSIIIIAVVKINMVFSAILYLLVLFKAFIPNIDSVGSVAIIGGADGPTAVFVTYNIDKRFNYSTIIIFLILLLLYKPLRYIIRYYVDKSNNKNGNASSDT